MSNIRSVSLYSYQEEYFLRRMTLEEMIAEVSRTGATGVELLAEQYCPYEYANPSDEFAATWHAWMEKYHTTPACLDIFNEQTMYYNRELTKEEQLAHIESNLRFASRLGFPTVRAMIGTPIRYMPEINALAEKYNIQFGIELHAPYHFNSPYFQEYFEFIERTGATHLGIVPDMSIFTIRVPRTQMLKLIRSGAHEEIIDRICECYEEGKNMQQTQQIIADMHPNAWDNEALANAFAGFYEDPQNLVKYMNLIVHIHGKVYSMTEDCKEPSLDYERVLPLLKEHGYHHFISTEYEGQRHYHDLDSPEAPYNEVEAVRRHQVMMKRLLGE